MADKIANPHHESDSFQAATLSYADAADPLWKRLLIQTIEYALGRRRLEKIYNTVRALPVAEHLLWHEARRALNIKIDWKGVPPETIRQNGPLIIVSNHPFGVVDGLILCELAASINPEFRVLINAVLTKDGRVSKFLIPIDFAETKEALATNLASRNRCLDLLAQNGLLLLFPAGGVSTAKPFWTKATDLDWKPFVVKLISNANATVLPVHVEGQNSRWFHIASAIHLSVRLALLLHEIRNKIGKTITVHLGRPIPPQTIHAIPRNKRLDWLRKHVENLPFSSW